MELEVLREKDQQRLRQLQQTLADLEHKEKRLTSERLQRDTHSNGLTLGKNALTNISQVTFSSPKFCYRHVWLVLLNYKPKPNPKTHSAGFVLQANFLFIYYLSHRYWTITLGVNELFNADKSKFKVTITADHIANITQSNLFSQALRRDESVCTDTKWIMTFKIKEK